jgi:cell division protease FtsH
MPDRRSGDPAQPPERPGRQGRQSGRSGYLLFLVLILAWVLILAFANRAPTPTTLSYSTFLGKAAARQVKTASIDASGKITGTLKNGEHYASQVPTALGASDLASVLTRDGVDVSATGPGTSWLTIVLTLLPIVLVGGFIYYLFRRSSTQLGAAAGLGRSRARVFDTERPTTTFSDVAGYTGVKRELAEIIEFLRDPDRFKRAGARGPRGVLMLGPPGTGKTLLARALAGEASVPFLSVAGSSFVEMFVGVGAARVRDLFETTRKQAPAIIFIDELDAIGQRRGGSVVANDEREQTLDQLLAEMDGFDPSEGVIILAATNRPEVLDPALLRPGRFDRQVVVPLPTRADRLAILKVHCRTKHLGPDVDLDAVARATPGFSGADLANLANEAAICAVRDGRTILTAADFDEARDRVLLGQRDHSNVLLAEERHAVAVHEAGHAVVAALIPEADPVAKVSILPAGQALGVTEQLPIDERHVFFESHLLATLAVRLGGRAAEQLVFHEASTGAADDLAGATQLATRMVREFGLSPELGPVSYSTGAPMYLGGEQVSMRTYSEATQRVVDEAVARLLREAEQRATELLKDHREQLDRVAGVLAEHETIDGELVYEIVGVPRRDAAPDVASETTAVGSEVGAPTQA